mmetsp:Transcript_14747/g.18239  ORF Transcript_14747/g.18239 Transcript_14747/m.18239 type:complete len:202 (-) Transcript_14747:245-850(-)
MWLEGNGFIKIEGLEHQKDLRTLYLQENCIDKIENLQEQKQLDTLNLSQNSITKIENLSHMKSLRTLLLGQNRLESVENLEHVLEIPSLSCLDIQKNRIKDPKILDLVSKMPNLSVLYLQGNPCVKEIRYYRKMVTARCKHLKYLDDRPVFPDDRLRAEAFIKGLDEGGLKAAQAAEKDMINKMRQVRSNVLCLRIFTFAN